MNNPIIEISGVTKSYQAGNPVLNSVSLNITEGGFITIIGPSGCGKTTLLRVINGMTEFDSGNIKVMGTDIQQWDKIQLRRNIGYVIQQGGLFPHLSVKQNMEFVLSISGNEKEAREKRVAELAKMMGFDEQQLGNYPDQLSGGQQQRVGVARALAAYPKIVLMDEPFGALDNITRRNLQNEIKQMHRNLRLTFIMVTHDLHEAFMLGTQVAIMNAGKIEQYADPEFIKANPASGWIKDFLTL